MLSLEPFMKRRDPAQAPLLTLGTMNFGKRTPAAEAIRVIARATERGVTLFDTANAYCDGESERILGRGLKGKRDDVAIATKVGFGRVGGRSEGLSRERVLTALDESLTRLGTDHVDVYYLHVPDHQTPLEETLSAIRTALDAGKIRAFGVSNYASHLVVEILHLCDAEGMPRPIMSQVLYNLLIRQLDLEYAGFARRHAMHTTVYNALAGGLLTGRHDRGAPPQGSRFDGNRLYLGRYWTDRFFDLVDSYKAVANEEGMTLADLSYAWLAGSDVVDSILLGPASVAQLDSAIDACAKPVSAEARRAIDSIHVAFMGTATSYAR